MRSHRIRVIRWPFSGSCVIVLLAAATSLAQSNESPGESITSYVRQAQATGRGAASGGHLFDPQKGLTTYGRAGSALRGSGRPLFREARRTRSAEIAYEPGAAIDAPEGPIIDGDITFESGPIGDFSGGCDGNCGGDCGGECDSCGNCSLSGGWGRDYFIDECEECVPLCLPRFKYLSLSAGVHGFKSIRDRGLGNNFGFQEGINLSGRLLQTSFGYQVGYQAVQSRLSGDVTAGDRDIRQQDFLTFGLFRRRKVGLQGGVVYDLLFDNLDEELEFGQVRAEASFVGPRSREIGFVTALRTDRDQIVPSVVGGELAVFQAIDQYQFFLRWHFFDGGEARVLAGFTGRGDGLLGSDVIVPISDSLSLQGGFNYLVPKDSTFPNEAIDESWNLAINLVWLPRCSARTSFGSAFRPLFNVADNGSMFIEQISP